MGWRLFLPSQGGGRGPWLWPCMSILFFFLSFFGVFPVVFLFIVLFLHSFLHPSSDTLGTVIAAFQRELRPFLLLHTFVCLPIYLSTARKKGRHRPPSPHGQLPASWPPGARLQPAHRTSNERRERAPIPPTNVLTRSIAHEFL